MKNSDNIESNEKRWKEIKGRGKDKKKKERKIKFGKERETGTPLKRNKK